MRFLIVDTYYPAFLKSMYLQRPGLADEAYDVQWRHVMDQCFGTADYYSRNLSRLGHEATEVIANCRPMQMQWAQEHGVPLRLAVGRRSWGRISAPWIERNWIYPTLLAQVKAYRPDVIHFQDPNSTDATFLRAIRPFVRLITSQIGCPISPRAEFGEYDFVLSCVPHYVQRFREQGLKSWQLRLAFEPAVLEKMAPQEMVYPIVHIGGYDRLHQERNELLDVLIQNGIPLSCWGYGIKALPRKSPIRTCYKGEAWGIDMFSIRHNSRMVVSRHVSRVADVYAGMMTMYESTGVGSLLVIDHRKDLQQLYEPGKEVIAYHNPAECSELVRYYLAHEDERKEIAYAGQQRTLREHTYYHRMQEFVDLVNNYL